VTNVGNSDVIMSAEIQDQDFERLQQLLKLKRHESPPPRFFNDFSFQVNARIRAGEGAGKIESFEDVVSQSPWLHRIWKAIEGKPAVSGLLAAALCGALIAVVFYVENPAPTMPAFATNEPGTPTENSGAASAGTLLATAGEGRSSLSPTAVIPGSSTSLFNNVLALPTAPVSFTPNAFTNGFR
jgi:hypothetical protein